MTDQQREQNIKSIIRLEDRVAKCGRCAPMLKCTSRPAVGRGDLQPETMIVFEAPNDLTRSQQWIVGLHSSVRQHFGGHQVYHTFMVRCQSRVCPQSQGNDCFLTSRLLDRNEICLLNNQPCDGIAVKPTNEAIINCLTFLLEEIAALQPSQVILVGARVTEFVLKACGVHRETYDQPAYRAGDHLFVIAKDEHLVDGSELQYLADVVQGM